MTRDEETQLRETVQIAYRQGIVDAKASMAADLRALADDFCEQVFQLRQEVRRALGLPPLANDRDTLQ